MDCKEFPLIKAAASESIDHLILANTRKSKKRERNYTEAFPRGRICREFCGNSAPTQIYGNPAVATRTQGIPAAPNLEKKIAGQPPLQEKGAVFLLQQKVRRNPGFTSRARAKEGEGKGKSPWSAPDRSGIEGAAAAAADIPE